MFSTALLLGLVSNPDIGAGWNATLAILVAGLGVLAIGYAVTLYARRFAGAGAVYEYLPTARIPGSASSRRGSSSSGRSSSAAAASTSASGFSRKARGRRTSRTTRRRGGCSG
jgi:hypothetical protein